MIQTQFAADRAPDFSRIPEPVRTAMLNWISAFSNRNLEMEKLNRLLRQNPAWHSAQPFLRSTSENGLNFQFPDFKNSSLNPIVAWSVIYDEKEILFAVNTNPQDEAIAYVTVDADLHAVDSSMFNLYASATCPKELNVEVRNGKAIRLTIPAYSFVIYG